MERDTTDENGERLPDWTVPAHDGFEVLEYWPSAEEPLLTVYPVVAWSSFSGSVVPVTPDWEANDGIKMAIMYGREGRAACYAVRYPDGRVSVPGQNEWHNSAHWRESIEKENGGDRKAPA